MGKLKFFYCLIKKTRKHWSELPLRNNSSKWLLFRGLSRTRVRVFRSSATTPRPSWRHLSLPELAQVAKGLGDVASSIATGRFLTNTTKEAAVKLLIGAEIVGFFYIGEVIGKGSLIGYDV